MYMTYTIKQLRKDFPTEQAVLEVLFDANHSKKCSCGGTYKPLFIRRQYQCSKCRFQIAPTNDTIFHKSTTPLTDWVYAIYLFSQAKSGISAKELERHLGCTYKTAWRMLKMIREALPVSTNKLTGEVEFDTMVFGGRIKKPIGSNNEGSSMGNKTPVYTAIQRKGEMRAKAGKDQRAYSTGKFIHQNIDKESKLYTDGSSIYKNTTKEYDREYVIHKKHQWVKDKAHINNVEGFFSHFRRSIKGTHKVISSQHLQGYLDAFAFHYNKRHNDSERFFCLFGALLLSSKVI